MGGGTCDLIRSYEYSVTANAGGGFICYENLSKPSDYNFLLVCIEIDAWYESRIIPFAELDSPKKVRSTNPDGYVPIITINFTTSINQVANFVYNVNAVNGKPFKVKLYGIK